MQVLLPAPRQVATLSRRDYLLLYHNRGLSISLSHNESLSSSGAHWSTDDNNVSVSKLLASSDGTPYTSALLGWSADRRLVSAADRYSLARGCGGDEHLWDVNR
jgi:hypothetical protein